MSSTNESTPVDAQAPIDPVQKRRPWPLALRLTAFYVGSSFVILLAAVIALYLLLESSLKHAQDQFLTEKVAVMRAMLLKHPEDVWQLNEEIEETYAPRQYSRVYTRILDDAGGVTESPGMSATIPRAVFPPPTKLEQDPRFGVVVMSVNGQPLRAMSASAQFGSDPTKHRTIQVALDTQLTRELLEGYRRTLLVVLAVGLIGCG